MPLLTNGDFSNGLTGWTVSGAGPTAPTHDPINNQVVFGTGNNDVQEGDRLEQEVALEAGQEYTLTFSATEMGSASGGFGLNVELIDVNGAGNTQFLDFVLVTNDATNSVSITFTSDFDDPVLRIRGAFGFGGVDSMLVLDDFVLTCFVEGTRILTPGGLRLVEDLEPGDLVTLENGKSDQVSYRATRHVTPTELQAHPEWYPVCISKGALGPDCPTRDLWVSPAHRMLMSGSGVELATGLERGLAPARQLAACLASVFRDTNWPNGVTYHHLLFTEHRIIFAEGAPTESFHPAKPCISSLDLETKEEVEALFPDLLYGGKAVSLSAPILKHHEIRAALAMMNA